MNYKKHIYSVQSLNSHLSIFWRSLILAFIPTSFIALSVFSLFRRLSTIYSHEDQFVSHAEALQTRLRVFLAIVWSSGVAAPNESHQVQGSSFTAPSMADCRPKSPSLFLYRASCRNKSYLCTLWYALHVHSSLISHTQVDKPHI